MKRFGLIKGIGLIDLIDHYSFWDLAEPNGASLFLWLGGLGIRRGLPIIRRKSAKIRRILLIIRRKFTTIQRIFSTIERFPQFVLDFVLVSIF